MMKKKSEEKIKWYHWVGWILACIALILLIYGFLSNIGLI